MPQTTFTPTAESKKFQRTYQILIQAKNGSTFTLGSADGSQPLLTLEFNIIRSAMSSAQSGNIRIKNINEGTRNAIGKNFWNNVALGPDGLQLWQTVQLQAGYVGSPLSTIFQGKANTIISYREEGGTDWITEIEGQDLSGLFSNCWSNWTDGNIPNYTQKNIITHLVGDLQGYATKNSSTLGIGCVNGFPIQQPPPPRYSFTANGPTMDLLCTETNRLVYIDNGQIFCMPSNYVFAGDVTEISSQTGLLGTPKIQDTYLTIPVVFEPSIAPGQVIYLDTELSEFSSLANGTYKVIGVQHAGTISSTVSGKAVTTMTIQFIPNPITTGKGLFPST